jgi:hypothetical protein
MTTSRFLSILVSALLLGQVLAGCAKREEESAEYQAACQGAPLRTLERREQAMQDGYEINRRYDCIGKASYAVMERRKAEYAAANTPEAIARRQEERERMIAEERARRAAEESREPAVPEPAFTLRYVDANTATPAELAEVPSVGPVVAAQVVEERQKGRFNGWDDLVRRVAGLSQAQSIVYASVCGLTVDGQSFPDAPADPVVAAKFYARMHRNSQP